MNILSGKVLSATAGAALLTVSLATPVFAWPTRAQDITCNRIHWEMQNDTNKTYEFVGRVTSPISFETKQDVKPNEWGVLDKHWNLQGNVKVKASISMGGDTRVVEKDLNCPVPSPTPSPSPTPTPIPTPSPTPSPSPKPSPTPSPSPTVSPTPSPSPSPSPTVVIINNSQEQKQEQHNNQTVNVTPQVLPETGVGTLGLATLATGGPLGFALTKFGRGKVSKRDESVEEFANRIFSDRNS